MIEATLKREYRDQVITTGELTFKEGEEELYVCCTLEPTWADNKRNISCIPAGEYNVVKYSSEKYPEVYEVQDVPGRSKILIHAGNFYKDTKGCILVGQDIVHIDADGIMDVSSSKSTLRMIKDVTKYENFRLIILEPTS
ncbi:MAG: DUF5675 family protein [Candidatus Thioglobus sp.]